MRARKHLMSLGYLAELIQRSPQEIETVLDQMGIAPEVRINGVAHFDHEAYCRLCDFFEAAIKGA